eukprot:3316783-Amphidinium_carterae.1
MSCPALSAPDVVTGATHQRPEFQSVQWVVLIWSPSLSSTLFRHVVKRASVKPICMAAMTQSSERSAFGRKAWKHRAIKLTGDPRTLLRQIDSS